MKKFNFCIFDYFKQKTKTEILAQSQDESNNESVIEPNEPLVIYRYPLINSDHLEFFGSPALSPIQKDILDRCMLDMLNTLSKYDIKYEQIDTLFYSLAEEIKTRKNYVETQKVLSIRDILNTES